jgi:hypothetical protein
VDTPVYMHKSFTDLLELLMALKVVGARMHKISHGSMLRGSGPLPVIPKHWIPIPVIGADQRFIEFIPYRSMTSDPFL